MAEKTYVVLMLGIFFVFILAMVLSTYGPAFKRCIGIHEWSKWNDIGEYRLERYCKLCGTLALKKDMRNRWRWLES